MTVRPSDGDGDRRHRGASRARGAWLLAASLVAMASMAACGARTGLDGGVSMGGAAPDAGPKPRDAGPDVAHVDDCADAGLVYIWAVADDRHLFRVNPATGELEDFGALDCEGFPNSMAVDWQGTAYIAFKSGQLYTVSPTGGGAGAGGGLSLPPALACSSTSFAVDQLGFKTFGMAYVADDDGAGETLYVAQGDYQHPSKGLAKIETQTYELEFIAPFSMDLGDAVELTGTRDGRLFGLFLANPGPGAHIAEIDKTNGQILSDQMVPVGTSDSNFAFAFWGGDFYLFAQHDHDPTFVFRYDPTTGFTTMWAMLPNEAIVGVGVSTCAPLL